MNQRFEGWPVSIIIELKYRIHVWLDKWVGLIGPIPFDTHTRAEASRIKMENNQKLNEFAQKYIPDLQKAL